MFCRTANWEWSSDGCELLENHTTYAVCACSHPGLFAVTTDMFNENVSRWRMLFLPLHMSKCHVKLLDVVFMYKTEILEKRD